MMAMLNETDYARRMKHKSKENTVVKSKTTEKPLHGQYLNRLNHQDVDGIETNRWLPTSGVKSELKSLSLQLKTNVYKFYYYRHKIINEGTIQNSHPPSYLRLS